MLGFFHIETYSRRRAAQRKGDTHTLSDIVGEMSRQPGHCNHVPRPRTPHLIHGLTPQEALRRIEGEAEAARDRRGFRLREDARVAVVFVASYPIAIHELVQDDAALHEYLDWERAAIAWATGEWEDAFRSAVRHVDEGYSHFHGILAEPSDAALTPLLHPGLAASVEVYEAWRAQGRDMERTGEAKREAWNAHQAAMIEMQDDYHVAVGSRYGHGRKGEVPQPRMSHVQHVMRYGRLKDRLPEIDMTALSPDALAFLGEELPGARLPVIQTLRRPKQATGAYTGPVTLLGR